MSQGGLLYRSLPRKWGKKKKTGENVKGRKEIGYGRWGNRPQKWGAWETKYGSTKKPTPGVRPCGGFYKKDGQKGCTSGGLDQAVGAGGGFAQKRLHDIGKGQKKKVGTQK